MPTIRIEKQIPYLINGKTDRQRLLRDFQLEREHRGEFDDWDSLKIPKNDAAAAKALIKSISKVTGRSIQDIATNLDDSFYNMGGSSLNSIEVIVKLREENYNISVGDFATAKNILEIIDFMEVGNGKARRGSFSSMPFIIEELSDSVKEDAVKVISNSFAHKGDLEGYTNSTDQEFRTLVLSIWKELVEAGFSFVVRRNVDKQIVGVSLNFDVYDEPEEIDASKGILYVLEMLDVIESRQREKLPKGKGKLIHSFMMGTNAGLDEADNVKVIETMEESVINMARRMNYEGVFTTNTNPLTKAICRDIHSYEVLDEYQVNQYVAPDGTKPWFLAPDNFTIICCWKKL